jgi:hypothetical protein
MANDTYRSGTFTLPFTTTGLHSLTASVSDTSNATGSTTFDVLVLASTDSAVVVQVVDSDGNPIPGALVSITGTLPGVTAYGATSAAPMVSVTDAQGVGIVFAAPGSQKITATSNDGSTTTTDTETLTAGAAFVGKSPAKPYSLTLAGADASARRR